MKKKISLMLVLVMMLGAFASCSKEEAPETTAQPAETAAAETAAAEEETEAPAEEETEAPVEEVEEAPAEEVEEAPAEEVVTSEKEEGYLIEQMDSWHWQTYNVVYVDEGDGNRYYDPDEMAEFVEKNPEWYKDTEMMAKWDEADAPFGDAINSSIAADTPFVTDKDNYHGLMVYKTFNVSDLDESTLYEFHMFYDNTVYCYINGEPYFILDGHFDSQDWNGGYDEVKSNQSDKSFKDFLHEGENYIAVSIKDAWGGREFDAYIYYETGSTKKTIEMVPQGAEWNYTVFYAPYIDGEGVENGGAGGGYFDPDDMAAYIEANPNFMTDTATASQWAVGKAPMSGGAEGWTESNHGLMLYKSFNVDSVDAIRDADYIALFGDYDNAIHVYLNGVEVYTDDGEANVQDWQYGYTAQLDKDLILNTLVDGENYFIITVKDAWGGREFNLGFSANWN